jgi:hypothetical protein
VGALLAAALGLAASVRGEAAPTSAEAAALREKVMPGVCRVTAQNAWGVPLAYANGFLLGQGRFVITDLGAVGQPGVAQVAFQFSDGTAGTSKQFGLADPALGLAALLVEDESAARPGLDLVADMPPIEGGLTVTLAGWRWCKDSDAVSQRLGRGPSARELAQRCGVEAPGAADVFLRVEGPRFDGAAGAPVVDRQGAVLAVKIDLAARDLASALAVPASSFRKTLLAAQPELKAITELPKPLWPARILRIPGEPVSQQDFASTVQDLKAAMVCERCGGTGVIKGDLKGIARRLLGDGKAGDGECPACHGDKIAYKPLVYTLFSTMVLEATRVAWSPVADEKTRSAVHTSAAAMLKQLGQTNVLFFQVPLAFAGWGDVGNTRKAMPRGVILYCEVADTVEGPDGKYILLGPYNSAPSVAVRADLLSRPAAKGVAARKLPASGDKIVLAGAVLGPIKVPAMQEAGAAPGVKVPSAQGVYVLPLDWAPAPGELPEPDPRARPPGRQPPKGR